MKFKNIIKCAALSMPFFLTSSCDNEDLESESNQVKVTFTVDEFECASTADTRTTITSSNGYLPVWASGDVIGIFPREGYQEPFTIPADQIGKSKATFDGGYWALKNGLTYNAYYPFDLENFWSAEMKTKIAVTYVGQKQNNVGVYDYTYSDWMTATGGAVNFSFHHLGAIAVFKMEVPATAFYTTLTFSANEKVIPTTGIYDLTAENVSLVPTTYANSISLDLDSYSGTAGETAIFYMMLPPMNLSGNELTLTLTSDDNTTCTFSVEPLQIVKGKKYELEGTPINSEVGGTIDGWGEREEAINPNRQILYTATDGNIVTPYNTSAFGDATIISNEYTDGKGVITFDKEVTIIDAEAFYHCENLATIKIPSSVTVIRTESFKYCKELVSIEIPSSVTAIGNSAFSMTALTSVEIPSSVTYIGNSAFDNCDNLTSIEIPSSVKSMGEYIFSSCSNLESVNLPSSITIEEGTFYYCTKLKSIKIPSSKTIGSFSFCGCYSLTTVNIPNSVETIGQFAFSECRNLASVKLSTSATSIEEGAFRYCGNLASIRIPSSVTSIGYDVFLNTGLTEIYCECVNPPTIKSSTFSNYSTKLYVPSSSVSTYQSANYWKNFTNIVEIENNEE